MQATLVITVLWLLFAATHMIPSSVALREKIVARTGEPLFLALYSLLSLAVFVPLATYYLGHKHAGPMLWAISLGLVGQWLLYLLIGSAFTLSVAGLMQPSPASFTGGTPRVHGVLRITRHPLFMGFGLLGLLHMIPNGFASDIAFFAGLPLFAILGCRHQDQRKLLTVPGYAEFMSATPFLPFTGPGIAQGLRELGPIRLAIGVAAATALRFVHPYLFGG